MTNCASNLSNYKKNNVYVNGNTVSISRNSLKDLYLSGTVYKFLHVILPLSTNSHLALTSGLKVFKYIANRTYNVQM